MPRMYVDMVGDLWHSGHASFCQRVRSLGDALVKEGRHDGSDAVTLVVGITNDEECGPYKRQPILTNEERCASARACRFVDEVIPQAPLVTTAEFMREHRIDFVVHGDDYSVDQVRKYYHAAIEADRYRTVPYTPGISTSDLIKRCAQRAAGTRQVSHTPRRTSVAGYIIERITFVALVALVLMIALISPSSYAKTSEQFLITHLLYFSLDKTSTHHSWPLVVLLHGWSLGGAFGALSGWTTTLLLRDQSQYAGMDGWCSWTQAMDSQDGLPPQPCSLILPRVLCVHLVAPIGHLLDLAVNWEALRASYAPFVRVSGPVLWCGLTVYLMIPVVAVVAAENLVVHSDAQYGGLMVDKYEAGPWAREAAFAFFDALGVTREEVRAQNQWPISPDFVFALIYQSAGVFFGVGGTILTWQLLLGRLCMHGGTSLV
jgi:cytidyltransferase-like protein